MKYQLKPEFIDVVKFTEDTFQECIEFTNGELEIKKPSYQDIIYGYMKNYDLVVYIGGYIVKLQNESFDVWSEEYLNNYYIPA